MAITDRSRTPADYTRPRPTPQPLWLLMAVASVAGVAVAALVGWLDAVLADDLPFEVSSVEVVHDLLTALIGGLVTVAVFSLWMRTVVVGLVADQFSPRILSTFLGDHFQRRLLAVMSGAFVVEITLLLGLPDDEAAPAPPLTLAVAVVVALAALAGVLLAIQHAIGSLALPRIVRTLTEHTLDTLDRQTQTSTDVQLVDATAASRPVPATEMGWVVEVDADALLAAVPPGAVVHLRVRRGSFVTPRSVVAMVTPPAGGEPADHQRVAEAVRVERTRDPELDLAFALGQLVDVAASSLSDGGKDTSTAHEALVHLGAALERIVEHGLPPQHHTDDAGRRLLDDAAWRPSDHVRFCADRLRNVAAEDPETTRHLLGMLGNVRGAAVDTDDDWTLAEVDEQIDTTLQLAEAHGVVAEDRDRLRRTADEIRAASEMVRVRGHDEEARD